MNGRMLATLGLAAILLAASGATADVFNMGPGLTGLETVPVGDPGNAGELSGGGAGGVGANGICGAVAYIYRIGKYEVTAGQYCEFLNAVGKTDTYGLYNTLMDTATYDQWGRNQGCNIKRTGSPGSYAYSVDSNWANRPVNYVSWGDAVRFANWLHNDQPTGAQGLSTTEDGAWADNASPPLLPSPPRRPYSGWDGQPRVGMQKQAARPNTPATCLGRFSPLAKGRKPP